MIFIAILDCGVGERPNPFVSPISVYTLYRGWFEGWLIDVPGWYKKETGKGEKVVKRNKDVEYFMHHAETCKNPKSSDYETMGGVCFIAAATYIKSLEAEVNILKTTVESFSGSRFQ